MLSPNNHICTVVIKMGGKIVDFQLAEDYNERQSQKSYVPISGRESWDLVNCPD